MYGYVLSIEKVMSNIFTSTIFTLFNSVQRTVYCQGAKCIVSLFANAGHQKHFRFRIEAPL